MNHPDVYHHHVCVRLVSLVSLVYWRILLLFLAHQYAPGDPLAVALGDDLKLESLLRLLENELPKTGRVLLGATAGVRQAMQDNTDICFLHSKSVCDVQISLILFALQPDSQHQSEVHECYDMN